MFSVLLLAQLLLVLLPLLILKQVYRGGFIRGKKQGHGEVRYSDGATFLGVFQVRSHHVS